MMLQPRAQHGSLSGVLPFNGQNAKLKLHDGDGRDEEIGGIEAFRPYRYIHIRTAEAPLRNSDSTWVSSTYITRDQPAELQSSRAAA